ncbi:Hypothetical protein DEACI_3882 [Acididesulfobacillus acetoxydans]|uniref:Uncharacterized protein n=1 Tax=Acididesulfobacillus acetoxydans TaxID=1561005 RepID=A0A8S0WA19_9FIRM|nr:Hypothetical protein DEACI_3882 [Acididesulfobacillus acetoxydans]CEJ08711.1 Hypothetical protein DEACI_3190 [Acididesulfobacillus acetoxydans]
MAQALCRGADINYVGISELVAIAKRYVGQPGSTRSRPAGNVLQNPGPSQKKIRSRLEQPSGVPRKDGRHQTGSAGHRPGGQRNVARGDTSFWAKGWSDAVFLFGMDFACDNLDIHFGGNTGKRGNQSFFGEKKRAYAFRRVGRA